MSFVTVDFDIRRELGISIVEYILAERIYFLAYNKGNRNLGWCYASKQTLADEIGYTRRGIIPLINRLEELGYIERGIDSMIAPTQLYHDIAKNRYKSNTSHTVQNLHTPCEKTSHNIKSIEIEEEKTNTNVFSKKKEPSAKEVKKKYGGGVVLLTDTEKQKLKDRYGEEDAKDRVIRLGLYIKSTGKKYANHYFTILNWDRMERDKQRKANIPPPTNEPINPDTGKPFIKGPRSQFI